jgi:deazaflavin-dependent oxidoreductase (nitroreductase family)
MDADGATMIERIGDRLARSDLSSKMHRLFYRLSGGRMGGEVKGVPVLLLTTVGRRSHKRRTVPLMYLPNGERLLVVASNAADPDRPPGWWFNLQTNPQADVRLGAARHRVKASDLGDEERRALWPRLAAHNPNWTRFQSETDRRFAVVALQLDSAEGST